MTETLMRAARSARACRLCDGELALGPRPVFKLHTEARDWTPEGVFIHWEIGRAHV